MYHININYEKIINICIFFFFCFGVLGCCFCLACFNLYFLTIFQFLYLFEFLKKNFLFFIGVFCFGFFFFFSFLEAYNKFYRKAAYVAELEAKNKATFTAFICKVMWQVLCRFLCYSLIVFVTFWLLSSIVMLGFLFFDKFITKGLPIEIPLYFGIVLKKIWLSEKEMLIFCQQILADYPEEFVNIFNVDLSSFIVNANGNFYKMESIIHNAYADWAEEQEQAEARKKLSIFGLFFRFFSLIFLGCLIHYIFEPLDLENPDPLTKRRLKCRLSLIDRLVDILSNEFNTKPKRKN